MTSDTSALLGLLFEHSPLPQFVSRANGSIVIANPAYAALMATTTEARWRWVVARLGGDEFVIVCPDLTGREQAEEIAERLLRAVASEPVAVRGRTIAITASLGVTLSSGSLGDTEDMLRHADAAMYQAKQQGRARFELFEDDAPD